MTRSFRDEVWRDAEAQGIHVGEILEFSAGDSALSVLGLGVPMEVAAAAVALRTIAGVVIAVLKRNDNKKVTLEVGRAEYQGLSVKEIKELSSEAIAGQLIEENEDLRKRWAEVLQLGDDGHQDEE